MTTYGVTPNGFLAKTVPTIATEVDGDMQKILGASAGSEPDGTIPPASFAGQLKQLLVDGFGAQWDLQQAVYSSRDPNQATGQSLDSVASITGSVRESAVQSSTKVTCTGTPNTSLQVGRVLTVTGTGARFDSLAAYSNSDPNYPSSTIAAATAWASGTGYTVGQRVTNNNNIYQCITSGTSAGSGGPTTTGSDITDNTVHWEFLGAGTGVVDVPFVAEVAGPIGALKGTLVNIATPVAGWSAAINLSDAVVGQNQELDSAFRARREAELASSGNTTVDGILAKVTKVNEGSTDPNHVPPTDVQVLFNDTDFVNADGLPPHSVEVVVRGGTDADIVQAIWNAVGAGTATYSSSGTSGTATDSEGNPQTVYYTRPTAVPIYGTATAYYDASKWPASSSSLVAQAVLSAILTYGTNFPTGQSVRSSGLQAAALRGPSQTDSAGNAVVPAALGSAGAPGILEVSPLNFGTSPGPVGSTTVAITKRQYASFSSANWTVTATSETP